MLWVGVLGWLGCIGGPNIDGNTDVTDEGGSDSGATDTGDEGLGTITVDVDGEVFVLELDRELELAESPGVASQLIFTASIRNRAQLVGSISTEGDLAPGKYPLGWATKPIQATIIGLSVIEPNLTTRSWTLEEDVLAKGSSVIDALDRKGGTASAHWGGTFIALDNDEKPIGTAEMTGTFMDLPMTIRAL